MFPARLHWLFECVMFEVRTSAGKVAVPLSTFLCRLSARPEGYGLPIPFIATYHNSSVMRNSRFILVLVFLTTLSSIAFARHDVMKQGENHTLSLPPSLQGYPDSLRLYYAAERLYIEGDSLKLAMGLDTMKLYIQLHPFATNYPGQTLSAIPECAHFLNAMGEGPGAKNDKLLYNWLIDAFAWNSDTAYRKQIIGVMANLTWNWDRNETANIWWNYAHWFNDSAGYRGAAQIRQSQHISHEDTLPFHVIPFPPAKVPIPGATVAYGVAEQIAMSLAISPNPSSVTTNVEFTVARSGLATLVLYDELGREVRRLISGAIPAGDHSISLALKDLQRGHYFLRLESEGSKLTRALIVE
jgi:hypothetical protein